MNSTQTYSSKTPLSTGVTGDNTSVTTIARTASQIGWIISVAAQDAYVTFDGSTPSNILGLTLPAGHVGFYPISGSIKVKAVTAGAIVNALPLE